MNQNPRFGLFWPNSLYRNCAGSHFYGKNVRFVWLWADCQYSKKKSGADYEELLRAVFSCFHGQKNIWFFLNIVASALKSCIISLSDFFFNCFLASRSTSNWASISTGNSNGSWNSFQYSKRDNCKSNILVHVTTTTNKFWNDVEMMLKCFWASHLQMKLGLGLLF